MRNFLMVLWGCLSSKGMWRRVAAGAWLRMRGWGAAAGRSLASLLEVRPPHLTPAVCVCVRSCVGGRGVVFVVACPNAPSPNDLAPLDFMLTRLCACMHAQCCCWRRWLLSIPILPSPPSPPSGLPSGLTGGLSPPGLVGGSNSRVPNLRMRACTRAQCCCWRCCWCCASTRTCWAGRLWVSPPHTHPVLLSLTAPGPCGCGGG